MEPQAENRPGNSEGLGADVQQTPSGPVSEAELAHRFTDRLRIFAARRLNDPAAAEDVAQETLRRVVEAMRANRVENLAALPGFVFQTARNICMHWVRSAGREQQALSRFQSESSRTTPDSTDALNSIISEERRAQVRNAMADLKDDDRGLLSMLYYEGLDSEVAASRLSVTTAALRVRKHRALRRLAELLGEVSSGNESSTTGTLYR
jgi:RNA polymerase sigma-70 factor (ECF subfamily)